MAIRFPAIGDGLTRDGSFQNPAADLTVGGWVEVFDGDYQAIWQLGGAAFGGDPSAYTPPWAGLTSSPTVVYAAANPGGGEVDAGDTTVTESTWVHVAWRYKASTTTLSLVIDGVETHAAVVDLSAMPAQSGEWLGTDTSATGSLGVAYWFAVQSWMTEAEIAAQMNAVIPLQTCLAFTPLTDPSNLLDVSGNGRHWSLLGSASIIAGPLGSIVFADDFSTALGINGWGNPIGRSAGGCLPGSYMVACANGSPYHAIATGGEIALRAQVAVLNTSISTDPLLTNDIFWLHFPGLDNGCDFIYGLGFNSFGHLSLRVNNVSSPIASANGLYPFNGSMFALQWRMTQLTPFTVAYAVDINNVTVWSGTYDWTGFSPSCPSGGDITSFYRVTMFVSNSAPVRNAIDNLEIDASAAMVDWPVCSPVAGACGIPIAAPQPVTYAIRRLRRAPHLNDTQLQIRHDRFVLDMETGLGTTGAPATAPLMYLRWSDDGGHTWSQHDHTLSAGIEGQYKKRMFRNRLGKSRDRIYEISTTDPAQWNIVAAYLCLTPMSS